MNVFNESFISSVISSYLGECSFYVTNDQRHLVRIGLHNYALINKNWFRVRMDTPYTRRCPYINIDNYSENRCHDFISNGNIDADEHHYVSFKHITKYSSIRNSYSKNCKVQCEVCRCIKSIRHDSTIEPSLLNDHEKRLIIDMIFSTNTYYFYAWLHLCIDDLRSIMTEQEIWYMYKRAFIHIAFKALCVYPCIAFIVFTCPLMFIFILPFALIVWILFTVCGCLGMFSDILINTVFSDEII